MHFPTHLDINNTQESKDKKLVEETRAISKQMDSLNNIGSIHYEGGGTASKNSITNNNCMEECDTEKLSGEHTVFHHS